MDIKENLLDVHRCACNWHSRRLLVSRALAQVIQGRMLLFSEASFLWERQLM